MYYTFNIIEIEMHIKIDPTILSINDELAFNLTKSFDLASTAATQTYHKVSIIPAIATITALSEFVISLSNKLTKNCSKKYQYFWV